MLIKNTTATEVNYPAFWRLRVPVLLLCLIVLPACSFFKSKLPPVERVATKTKTVNLTIQLSQKPTEINIPAFDEFGTISQGDVGGILKLLRKLKAFVKGDKNLEPEITVIIDKFERGVMTLTHRACDLKKPNCKKLEDGSLTFPGPLNHYTIPANTYLTMAKAWQEIKRYIEQSEYKFDEDQRRVDEAVENAKGSN